MVGGSAAVVVDDHRVLLLWVEAGRQTEISVDFRTVGCGELPLLHLAELNVADVLFLGICHDGLLSGLEVDKGGHAVIGEAAAAVGYPFRFVVAHGEVLHVGHRCPDPDDLAVGGIETIDEIVETSFGAEIDLAVGMVPDCAPSSEGAKSRVIARTLPVALSRMNP